MMFYSVSRDITNSLEYVRLTTLTNQNAVSPLSHLTGCLVILGMTNDDTICILGIPS